MSLVGTRPILQDELRQYELHHRARIAIKPGITGMWQVSGRSDIKKLIRDGISTTASCAIIAEIGIDMKPFKTAEHICSCFHNC